MIAFVHTAVIFDATSENLYLTSIKDKEIVLLSFEKIICRELQDMENLTVKIRNLKLVTSPKDLKTQTNSLEYLLKNATDKLPQICDTYLSVCFENHGRDLKNTWCVII